MFAGNLYVSMYAFTSISELALLAEYGLDPENISGLYPQLRSLTAGLAVTF